MLQPITNTFATPVVAKSQNEKQITSKEGFQEALDAVQSPPKLLETVPLFKYAHSHTITGEDIRRERDEALDDVKARLKRKLSDAGLTPPRKIEVAMDGRIVVESDNPHKQEIEALIQQDGMLDGELRKVLSLSTLIRSFEEAIPFQKAYAKDPKAAVQQYAYLFNDLWTNVSSLVFDEHDFYRVETNRRLKSSLASLADIRG